MAVTNLGYNDDWFGSGDPSDVTGYQNAVGFGPQARAAGYGQPPNPYGLSLSNLRNRAVGAGFSFPFSAISNYFYPPAPDDHGDAPPDVMSPEEIARRQAANAPPPPPVPQQGPPGYLNSTSAVLPQQQGPPGYLHSTSATDAAPAAPKRTPAAAATAAPSGAAPKRTPGTPNLGYYPPNDRFVQIDRPNMTGMGVHAGGPPQMTALNLAGLFGGGGNAVNPNVPAPNAQPVSATTNPLHYVANPATAPWGMGPLQKGRSWPTGPDWDAWNAARQAHQAGGY
jgi:hypothetical protein